MDATIGLRLVIAPAVSRRCGWVPGGRHRRAAHLGQLPGGPAYTSVVAGNPTNLSEVLVHASPDAIVVVDGRGRITSANAAVEVLFGFRSAELVGEQVEVLIPEDRRAVHVGRRADYARHPAARPMGTGLDLFGRRCDGTTFPVDVSLVPVDLDGRPHVAAYVRDATERRRREDLLRHVNEVSQHLLASQPLADTLALTARRARELAHAAASWVVRPNGSGEATLVVAAADGGPAPALLGSVLPLSTSLSGRAIASGGPLVLGDMSSDPAVLPAARAAGLGPGAYLPMLAEDSAIGVLVVARLRGSAPFSEAEVASLEVFASAAAVVLALGSARDELEELRVVAEQERIARELHDTVIQRLFALGMSLQGAERLAEPAVAERIGAAVDGIDQVIREIRQTIFDLQGPPGRGGGLRQQVGVVAAEAAAQLGFPPRVTFRGPVEAVMSGALASHVLSVLREALSNVARHAKATRVEVTVEASDSAVTVSVADDGVGIADHHRQGNGLVNMASRAAQLGGELTVTPRRPTGTLLRWRVPSAH